MAENPVRDETNLLLSGIIDLRAHFEPKKLFCVLLDTDIEGRISETNEITYSDFSNAINKCAWWISSTFADGPEVVLGYLGPPDIRYAIIALAAAKSNHKAGPFLMKI